MTFLKLGEATDITPANMEVSSSVCDDPEILKVLEEFRKTANALKTIAPKAKDFLYFSAIMMHAAELAAINQDGTIKLGSDGKPIECGWDKSGDTWKWVCSDSNIKPYKNNNADIFPEEELIKAHKKWVGRPLCLDHKSSSVDFVRGVIVDTYYDRKNKRVVALCALDKVNYPDLARKVATGYATSVSMGTAVGKAICTECGRVARVESDFCNHMRNRECYGEINIDLTPIELSIVVNGADPKAKIKHIVAAANAIGTYMELKKAELDKVADGEHEPSDLASLKKEVEQFKNKLSELENEITDVEKKASEDENKVEVSPPYGESSGSLDKKETELSVTNQPLSGPTELPAIIASVEKKLDSLTNKVNSLIETDKDNKMTTKKGYFQGGGGVNEPAPGEVKYPKEEDKHNEEDKHMNGAPPFPEVGGADDMYPGDEQKKKELQRLGEVEARNLKRAEAVRRAKENLAKQGYFQNGDDGAKNPNTPTPGKPKYPKDPDDHRETDKHMNGAPPFPDVGKIDGLYGDDLKEKEKLNRANDKIKGKFIKATNTDGSDDRNGSRWDVYAGDKLVLSATVGEIVVKNPALSYEDVATRVFGEKILRTVKNAGIDKASSIFKSAQGAPPPTAGPGAMPAMPPDMGGAGPAPTDLGAEPPPMGDEPVDEGEAGDPAKRAKKLADKIRDAASDLAEAIDALTGEQKELADDTELATPGAAPEAVPGGEMGVPAVASDMASLQSMRKFLNGALLEGMKEAVAELNEHEEELKLIAHISSQGKVATASSEDKGIFSSLSKEAFEASNMILADSYKLLSAFVKYARGTEALESRGQAGGAPSAPNANEPKKDDAMVMPELKVTAPKPPVTPKSGETAIPQVVKPEEVKPEDIGKKLEDIVNAPKKPQASEELDLTTKEGRAMYRTKLAQKGVEWSSMLKEFHPKGGFTTELDTKPEGDLAKVETLDEAHEKFMDVALAPPPKVKKAAEQIQRAVLAGQIEASEVDNLVAHGVDAEAIKYWKQFYGQAPDGGAEFASELVKEYSKAKVDEEKQAYQIKLARAYELAYDMADRGLIARASSDVKQQVEEIMKFNDASFESLKKVVARHPVQGIQKQASIPQVGLLGSEEIVMPASSDEGTSLQEQIEKVFGNRRF